MLRYQPVAARKVAPFYLPFRGLAVEDIWHDNKECPLARSLAVRDWRAGKGHGRKYCPVCAAINAPFASRRR